MREIKYEPSPILGDRYKIGDNGTVVGIKGKGLKLWHDKDGYPHVWLVKGKERYFKNVHRLVMRAFTTQPNGKPHINHKNGDRKDNRLENLEWVTHRENCLHGWANGRKHSEEHNMAISERSRGEKNPKSKLTEAQVREIRSVRSSSMMLYKDIATIFNISIAQVGAICNNKFWKHAV